MFTHKITDDGLSRATAAGGTRAAMRDRLIPGGKVFGWLREPEINGTGAAAVKLKMVQNVVFLFKAGLTVLPLCLGELPARHSSRTIK